jgi:hypothetical protein
MSLREMFQAMRRDEAERAAQKAARDAAARAAAEPVLEANRKELEKLAQQASEKLLPILNDLNDELLGGRGKVRSVTTAVGPFRRKGNNEPYAQTSLDKSGDFYLGLQLGTSGDVVGKGLADANLFEIDINSQGIGKLEKAIFTVSINRSEPGDGGPCWVPHYHIAMGEKEDRIDTSRD